MVPAGADLTGRALHPEPSYAWIEDTVRVLGDFVGVADAEDDMVDAIAHAFNYLESGSSDRALRTALR